MAHQLYQYRTPRFMDDSVYRSGPSSSSTDRAITRDPRNSRSSYSSSPRTEYRNITVDERGMAIDPRSLYDNSSYHSYTHASRSYRDDEVRRANLGEPSYLSDAFPQYRQIRPRLCSDGRYPPGFSRPRPVEEFQTMSDAQLQRIMLAYELRRASTSRYRESDRAAAEEDLFRYLGEDQLVDDLRRRGRL